MCDPNFQVKIKFFRSDLLRQTVIVMRAAQYYAQEQPALAGAGPPVLRTAATVEEVTLGLRR
eukprot:8813412-Alexandrium_andersonii.AAC.1